MTPDQAFAFLAFAFVAAITPGPSNIILTSTGANVGVLRGLPCLIGAAIGMGLLVFLVAVGLGSLVLKSSVMLTVLKWGGIGFLLWLSWKIATARWEGAALGTSVVGFWRAAALQWVNPKAWVVSASAAGTFFDAETNTAFVQSMGFGILFFLAALPSGLVWLAFGATVQGWLHTERAWRIFNGAMGMLLAGSIVLFIW